MQPASTAPTADTAVTIVHSEITRCSHQQLAGCQPGHHCPPLTRPPGTSHLPLGWAASLTHWQHLGAPAHQETLPDTRWEHRGPGGRPEGSGARGQMS